MRGKNYSMEPDNEEECQLPSAKRFKKCENKEREDLSQSSLNIIDKHLATEEKELSSDIETIEDRILTLQQLLHSVKYHASLNLYAYDRVFRKSDENCDRKNSLNHPTIQRYFGKSGASVSSFPNEEKLSRKSQNHDNENNADNYDFANSSDTHKETKIPNEINKADRNKQVVPKQELLNKQLIPELEPIIIGQRRREPFQKKVRIYLGNTYRYIKDLEGANPMKFQWRITLRTQDKDPIENFISSVKYTLHESYAPNNVIVKKSPFTLTHFGWGEFQVNVELRFVDERNKPIKLIHTLKLARKGDSLSYSGLWRLGHENLYEIWIFDIAKDLEIESMKKKSDENHEDEICEENMKVNFPSSGICEKVSYKDKEGNLTFCHSPKRCENPNEECSTKYVPHEEWVNMDNKYTNLVSKNITGIGSLADNDGTISYLDNFYCKDSNFVNLDENCLSKSSNESTRVQSPDLISIKFENEKFSNALSESSYDHTSDNMNIFYNSIQTAVDVNTMSDSVASCSKKPISIEDSRSLDDYSSLSNLDTIKCIQSKKLINIKPSLKSKSFSKNISLPIPKGTLKAKSADLTPSTFKSLFAGLSKVKLKTVSLSKVKKFQKNLNTVCIDSNSDLTCSTPVKNKYSINPNVLKTKLLALSTFGNHKIDKKSSDNPYENNFLSDELADEKLITPTSSSLPSTPPPQDQIILTCGKKDISEQTEKQLSALPQSFYNISTKKFIALAPHSKVVLEDSSCDIHNELNYINKLENKKLEIRGLCVKCSSVEEVLPIYWKNLQSFLTLARNFGPSSADSQTFSTRCCERSVEFWLGREICKELKILNLKDEESWNTAKIVSWARKHLFICKKIDISYIFELEKNVSSKNTIDTTSSLNIASSCSDDYRDNEDMDLSKKIKLDRSFLDNINVVDSDENTSNQMVDGNPEDREIVMFTPDFMVEPIQFIDSVLSRTRNRLRPEEIIEGVNMDIAKYILYKATLSLIEDLLRRSFPVAAAEVYHKKGTEETLESKPITINEKHVFTVLSNNRLSFQTLTQCGLGKKFAGPFSTHNTII